MSNELLQVIGIFLLFAIPFAICLVGLFLLVGKNDCKNNYKNFNRLAGLLNTTMTSNLTANRLVKGLYKGRLVEARLYSFSDYCYATYEMDWKRKRTGVPIQLSIQPLGQLRIPSKFKLFLRLFYFVREITEKTWLRDDGKIYYTRVAWDGPFQWFYWQYPKLSYEKNKDSLMAFLTLDLNEEDIKVFLEELVKAAEIFENSHKESNL